jgi:hypothetical protein
MLDSFLIATTQRLCFTFVHAAKLLATNANSVLQSGEAKWTSYLATDSTERRQ